MNIHKKEEIVRNWVIFTFFSKFLYYDFYSKYALFVKIRKIVMLLISATEKVFSLFLHCCSKFPQARGLSGQAGVHASWESLL